MKALLIAAAVGMSASTPTTPAQPETKVAMVCFKSGEQMSGMNKICYYNCAGSTAAITVASYELCPLSINN